MSRTARRERPLAQAWLQGFWRRDLASRALWPIAAVGRSSSSPFPPLAAPEGATAVAQARHRQARREEGQSRRQDQGQSRSQDRSEGQSRTRAKPDAKAKAEAKPNAKAGQSKAGSAKSRRRKNPRPRPAVEGRHCQGRRRARSAGRRRVEAGAAEGRQRRPPCRSCPRRDRLSRRRCRRPPTPSSPPPRSTSRAVKRAIEMVRSRKQTDASEVKKNISDPAAKKLVEWVILRSDDSGADFARYAAFIAANPNWPSIVTLAAQGRGRRLPGAAVQRPGPGLFLAVPAALRQGTLCARPRAARQRQPQGRRGAGARGLALRRLLAGCRKPRRRDLRRAC